MNQLAKAGKIIQDRITVYGRISCDDYYIKLSSPSREIPNRVRKMAIGKRISRLAPEEGLL